MTHKVQVILHTNESERQMSETKPTPAEPASVPSDSKWVEHPIDDSVPKDECSTAEMLRKCARLIANSAVPNGIDVAEWAAGLEARAKQIEPKLVPASETGELPDSTGLWFRYNEPYAVTHVEPDVCCYALMPNGIATHLRCVAMKGGWSKAVPASTLTAAEIERLEYELTNAVCHLEAERRLEDEAQAEITRLRSILSGVQGALADAGNVLCQREDGDYGASVRELVGERDRLKGELAEVQKLYTEAFNAGLRMAVEKQEAERVGEEAKANIKLLENEMEGHDKPCHYCGKACSSLSGRPSLWPVALCHPDKPGVVRWHHTGCVSERLIALTTAQTTISELRQRVGELERERTKLTAQIGEAYSRGYSDAERLFAK